MFSEPLLSGWRLANVARSDIRSSFTRNSVGNKCLTSHDY